MIPNIVANWMIRKHAEYCSSTRVRVTMYGALACVLVRLLSVVF